MVKVWHVPFHESNFICFAVCYIRAARPQSQVNMKQRPKNNWTVIVSYAILGRRTSFFPVLRRCVIISESHKSSGQDIPLKRTPFVDDASCSRCRLRRSSSRLRSAANRSFSSRSSRASYSSSVSFRSPTGSPFPDREGECSSSFCCLCLRFRLCRLLSRSVVLPGERDRWCRLWRLWVLSDSSPDSLALTEDSFAGSKAQDEL